MEEFFAFMLVGLLAQLVDSALGMAYGLLTTTLLLSLGVTPAVASATTHVAEVVTTGFSALAHHRFGNVNRVLFWKLLLPGICGAVGGAVFLSHIDNEWIKPFIAFYLMCLGIVILFKAFHTTHHTGEVRRLRLLGFCGGFLDAVGGGGWGSVVTSTLVAHGGNVRTSIGSVNACEFFIATSASFAFFLSNIEVHWQTLAALALGGAIASPVGAFLCRHLPLRLLLILVGTLVTLLSLRMFWISFLRSSLLF